MERTFNEENQYNLASVLTSCFKHLGVKDQDIFIAVVDKLTDLGCDEWIDFESVRWIVESLCDCGWDVVPMPGVEKHWYIATKAFREIQQKAMADVFCCNVVVQVEAIGEQIEGEFVASDDWGRYRFTFENGKVVEMCASYGGYTGNSVGEYQEGLLIEYVDI